MFIIHTDLKPYSYIVVANNNKMSLTTDINKATIFEKKITAENLVKSNLNSKKKRQHNYTYSSVEDLGYTINSKTDTLSVNKTGVEINDFKSLDNILSGIKEIEDYANNAQKKLEELLRNLSNIDKACTDLDHYMELNNLSASEGWKAYKQKQKLLKVRRNIKNKIFAYQKIVDPLKTYMNGNIYKSIEGLKNQKYSPRIMTGLFNLHDEL